MSTEIITRAGIGGVREEVKQLALGAPDGEVRGGAGRHALPTHLT